LNLEARALKAILELSSGCFRVKCRIVGKLLKMLGFYLYLWNLVKVLYFAWKLTEN
jgi:hypothetical protein